MKWLVVVLCLARYVEGGALKCTPGIGDTSCTAVEEKELPAQIEQDDSVKEPAITEAECLAGSEWESNCHFCRCTEFGMARCRRLAECDHDFAEPLKCKPNTTFSRDCNTCVCLENGLGLCTLESCRRSTIPKKSELVSGKECASGTHWKSQCNDCGCSSEGYAFCTEKACLDQDTEPMMRCAPDTMWNNVCNTCWCTTDGRAMCTRMGCSEMQTEGNAESSEKKVVLESDETLEYHDKKIKQYNEQVTKLHSVKTNDDSSKEVETETENERIKPDRSFEELDYDVIESRHDLEETNRFEERTNNLEETDSVKDTHTVLKRSVCKPAQVFQSECNTCKCSPDGQSYTCTQNECMEGDKNEEVEVFMENQGVDHIERHSVCKPRGIFYIGCNTCHCNLYGTDYSCTNKPCPLPEDVELFHELKVTKSSKNRSQEVVCVANRMFIKDCNTCWCNEDGTSFFCTRRVCVPDLPEEGTDEAKVEGLRIIKKECRPDEVFELDCNMCRCNPDGKSFSCTRRACVEQPDEDQKNASLIRKTRGVSQEAPKACQPGQEFRMDCNKCLCDNEGQDFSCTRIDCNSLNGNGGGPRNKRDTSEQIAMECSPGSVFDKDCNVCRCTADGRHAMCTIKRCTVNNNQDNDVNAPVSESTSSFRCNPGEQFKRGCNDCSCSADGKSVFCTVRYCDQDITPPPSI